MYEYVARAESVRSGKGKIIKSRWLDVSKGDSINPHYKLRFVGKEFNTGVGSIYPLCRHPAPGSIETVDSHSSQ